VSATKERQAWCCLQVKLCDPCLSTLCVPSCKKALYKYSSFPFLSFMNGCVYDAEMSGVLTGMPASCTRTRRLQSLQRKSSPRLLLCSWNLPSMSNSTVSQKMSQSVRNPDFLPYSRSSSFWATVCKTACPVLSDRCPLCLDVMLVYCGQTVGWIKQPLHFLSLRMQACLRQACVRMNQSPCLLWPNSWMDQDTTWYGGRPCWPRRHCIRWGPISTQK